MTEEELLNRFLAAPVAEDTAEVVQEDEVELPQANREAELLSQFLDGDEVVSPEVEVPIEEPERPERSALQKALAYTGGLAGSANQGLIPFSDEIISGVRSVADPSLYGDDSTIGERYTRSHDELNQNLGQFREDNPKTAIGTEITAGFASPLNKLGPVTRSAPQTAGFLKKAYEGGKGLVNNIARNAVEGGIYGYGEGTGENRIDNAQTAAAYSALLTGALDTGGRAVGSALDWWKLPNSVRPDGGGPRFEGGYEIDPNFRMVDGNPLPPNTPTSGENGPLMMSNPESMRGSLFKAGLAKLPGASQRIDAQNAPYVLRDRGIYQGAVDDAADEASRLADHQRSAGIDVKNEGRAERRVVQENQREGLSAARAAERQALELENSAAIAAAREADDAAATAATNTQRKVQAENQANEALNIETLQLSVPADRADAVTETGNAGFKQALDQVNEAYGEAWGAATDLAEGTIDKVIARSKKAQAMLGEVDTKRVERIIDDAEKLGEEGGSVQVLDELLRNSINATEDQLVRTDLEAIRETLRSGLPAENQVKLEAVDRVYPNLLATQKAASKAYLQNGIPTPEILGSASNIVAGERRAAKGEQPMMPLILDTINNRTPEVDVVPPLKAPATEQAAQAKLKKAVAREAKDAANQTAQDARLTAGQRLEDIKDDLTLRNQYETETFDARTSERIDPLKEKMRQTEANARADNPSLYMAALLANAVPGSQKVPLALKASGVSGLGELLATMPSQQFIAGQGKRTRMLADALRSGRTEYVTRALSRGGALSAPTEEEEYYIYR